MTDQNLPKNILDFTPEDLAILQATLNKLETEKVRRKRHMEVINATVYTKDKRQAAAVKSWNTKWAKGATKLKK